MRPLSRRDSSIPQSETCGCSTASNDNPRCWPRIAFECDGTGAQRISQTVVRLFGGICYQLARGREATQYCGNVGVLPVGNCVRFCVSRGGRGGSRGGGFHGHLHGAYFHGGPSRGFHGPPHSAHFHGGYFRRGARVGVFVGGPAFGPWYLSARYYAPPYYSPVPYYYSPYWYLLSQSRGALPRRSVLSRRLASTSALMPIGMFRLPILGKAGHAGTDERGGSTPRASTSSKA